VVLAAIQIDMVVKEHAVMEVKALTVVIVTKLTFRHWLEILPDVYIPSL